MSKCSKNLYQSYLQASSVRYSGLALSEVSPVELSHDSVSYWLKKSKYQPAEVFKQTKDIIGDKEGYLVFDDSVLDKHRSKKIDLVNSQYSGNKHGVTDGIGMVNTVWQDVNNKEHIPVDFRIYNKSEDGKTKNDHFREMLRQSIKRRINFSITIFDTWYSSLNNLKAVRCLEKDWVAGLKANRKVNKNETLRNIDIPVEGLVMHLRGYGWIKVFKFETKKGRIDYIGTSLTNLSRAEIKKIYDARWGIEVYHRELKQTCGIERCQSRTGRAQRNHICLAVLAWIKQHYERIKSGATFYQQCWDVIKNSISSKLRMLLMC